MAHDLPATSDEGSPDDEKSWERIARQRRLRAELEREIMRDTPTAVAEAKAAGVKVTELAELWNVTAAWIYTVAPARSKKKPGEE